VSRGDVQELRNDHVPFVVAAAANDAFPGIAKLTRRRIGDLADVEPSIDRPLVARQVWIAQQIGVRSGERDAVRGRRESWPVLECANCPDLPAAADFLQQIMRLLKERQRIHPGHDQPLRPIEHRRAIVRANVLDRLQASSGTHGDADAAPIQVCQRFLPRVRNEA
jgi:hypothetical protein